VPGLLDLLTERALPTVAADAAIADAAAAEPVVPRLRSVSGSRTWVEVEA
jgi:hypothetical protein